MAERYPNQLSYSANNLVVALSDTEVAKIFRGDTRSGIGSEAEKLKVANGINGLLVRFVRLDYDEAHDWNMLVMERLYSLDFRSLEIKKREPLLDVLIKDLQELHRAGFVHNHLRRLATRPGLPYDDVILTHEGLRLIDVGTSELRSQIGYESFAWYVAREERQTQAFREYFLSR